MPSKKFASQKGNSCAAHCTVLAVKELLDVEFLDKDYAEGILWPAIKFQSGESPLTELLAQKNNSDPRRIVSEAELRWSGSIKASMVFDDTEKSTALGYVDQQMQFGLGALFNMLKGTNQVTTITPQDGIYYNCSYLMMNGAIAKSAKYDGMHNILVTKSGGSIWYYNSNETTPVWTKDPLDWKTLENQNSGAHCYIFTGVCVELRHK